MTTMSWLARSLANSLAADHRSDDDDDGGGGGHEIAAWGATKDGGEVEGEDDPSRSVKEDLSEITKTLTRQFWGVASFLAPPPHSPSSTDGGGGHPSPDPAEPREADSTGASDFPPIAGIRSDFAEIGGRFRSGISRLSGRMGVSEISKIASNFLPFGPEEVQEEDEEDDRAFGGSAIGITDEVMSFVRNISMHAETWLDFPLLSDDEDCDDFEMSDAQIEHALAVECLSPRLAALRIELCPSHMSEGCFWKTYFVLLHPRLSKHDAELLSTAQIVEARALLLQKLQNQAKSDSERLVDVSYRKADETSFSPKQITTSKDANDTSPSKNHRTAFFETENQAIDIEVIDKSVINEEEPPRAPLKELNVVSKVFVERLDEDEEDDWLEDETGDIAGSGSLTILKDHEDVSFSDLEEDDERAGPKAPK